MHCQNNTIYKKQDDKKINVFILIGIIIYTLGTYTLNSFLTSSLIEVTFSITCLLFIIFSYVISSNKIYIYKVDLLWFLFFSYFLINLTIHSQFQNTFYLDIIGYAFIFLFLIFAKIDAKYFVISIKILFLISIIYALSSIMQYYKIELYMKYFIRFFTSGEREEILRIYNNGNMTGFTWQTAFIASYVTYGIAITFISYKYIKSKFSRILMLSVTILMFLSLFMSGKRAHLLFMFISLFIVFFFSAESKKMIKQGLKLITILFSSMIILTGFLLLVDIDEKGPMGNVINRFFDTINGLEQGEDITSGRVYLYRYALELFSNNPIFGIGWREFKEISVGIINYNTGSHPHNIYIQLLTELGIIGFILFVLPMIYSLIKTIKLLVRYSLYFGKDLQWKFLLQFSLFVQSFFFLYGITGNLLTDRVFLYIYAFAVAIAMSAIKYTNNLGTKVKGESI